MRIPVCGLLALMLVGGCSKHPSAPPVSGPTRFVVFTSDRGRAPGDYRNFFATLDGAGASELPSRGGAAHVDRHPSITQDGRVVAYQGSNGRGGSQDVFLFNRSSNALTDDPNVNTTFDELDPYISLDGTRLVFVRDSLGLKRLRLYDLVNSRLIPLPNLAAAGFSDWEPSMDALGRRIVFTSNRNGSSDVYVYQVSLASLTVSANLQSAAGDQQPAISHDGRYVAFASNRTGGQGLFDLFLYDMNTGLLVDLPTNANSPNEDLDPTISQDGSNLVLVSNRPNGEGGFDLWNCNRIGGTITQPNGEATTADDLDPSLVWP